MPGDSIPPMEPEMRARILASSSLRATGLEWLSVLGALQLALQHPKYLGPSRFQVERFVARLGFAMVDQGLLTSDEWIRSTAEASRFGTSLHPVPTCVGCGCSDARACPGGCFWVVLDWIRNVGVCSVCYSRETGVALAAEAGWRPPELGPRKGPG